jgi:hypothetical protein
VHDELLKQNDWVKTWLAECDKQFFRRTSDADVISAYRQIINWTQNNPNFTTANKSKFAAGADGWLIAYALCNKCTIATQEIYEPQTKAKIKIPNVCEVFHVNYCNTFDMLRALEIRFGLKKRE